MTEKLLAAVEKHRRSILTAERELWKLPETGFREKKTSAYLKKQFEKLGYTLTLADGLTGFYTRIDTGRSGPEVLLLAELDAVICPSHPAADPKTGAVHACGHHAQCAALLGIAAALKEEGVLNGLSGKIRLCAVPAEELLELEFRQRLKERGAIRYFSGKTEFLSRGYFDGVDIAVMAHTSTAFSTVKGNVGCRLKKLVFHGKAAHAGGAPWQGVNALYAATCGLNAVNALRETFRESDMIRVHPIVTQGGASVNSVPDRVELESYVRGTTFSSIDGANRKIDRAFCGGAVSLGAGLEIFDTHGYAPLVNDDGLLKTVTEAAKLALPNEPLTEVDGYASGSTDMGDLSCLMPVVHPYTGGASGTTHGADYQIADAEAACVKSAAWQLATVGLLLEKGGARAREIVQNYKPLFPTKKSFLAYLDGLNVGGTRVEYGKNSIKIKG